MVSTVKVLKYNLIMEQKGKCYYCGVNLINLHTLAVTIDHREPLAEGVVPNNKVLACRGCNQLKSTFPEKDFIKWLEPYKKMMRDYNKTFWKK